MSSLLLYVILYAILVPDNKQTLEVFLGCEGKIFIQVRDVALCLKLQLVSYSYMYCVCEQPRV